jgi:UDP-N-acetylmuramoyl-L-alanyl-D-glutamate--2,6-diaminopimelate ligase
MTERILRFIERFIPAPLYRTAQPAYHLFLALVAALLYRFPSRKIKVVFVTGTKGKSSTVELTNAVLEAGGYKTAMASTIHFKIGDHDEDNLYKMTIPGRFFLQRFLRQAVNAGCDYAVIEMTSQGAVQFRHSFISPDALIYLNLAPEHIESHGSYEKYVQAKLLLASALARSKKPRTVLVANADDKEAPRFLAVPVKEKYPFSIFDAMPYETGIEATRHGVPFRDGVSLTFAGETIISPLPGRFSIYNILAAATYGMSQNISPALIKKGIERVHEIRGRAQKITLSEPFDVIVDYAHTPDSLIALYEAFAGRPIIGVLGNTGGGRDTWKRKAMAEIAEAHCDHIILTDEDPYDDDPRSIVDDMARHITKKPLEIIMDRRKAIRKAIEIAANLAKATTMKKENAEKRPAILITGKGTDPYIMRAHNTREAWSDARVASEELAKALPHRS